jgi:hypothetical protein
MKSLLGVVIWVFSLLTVCPLPSFLASLFYLPFAPIYWCRFLNLVENSTTPMLPTLLASLFDDLPTLSSPRFARQGLITLLSPLP